MLFLNDYSHFYKYSVYLNNQSDPIKEGVEKDGQA